MRNVKSDVWEIDDCRYVTSYCMDLYKEIVKLRPEWHSDDDDKGVIKIVMTGSSSDPVEWRPFIGNKNVVNFSASREG